MDTATDHSGRAHSRFGGSVAARFIACPGSVALCEGMPDSTSRYAEEGTRAHILGEYCLGNGHWNAAEGAEATCYYDAAGDPWVFPQDMIDAVQDYLDAVYAEMKLTDSAELYVEKRFELELANADKGEVFGANDALVYHPSTGRVAVFDYKHGAGVSVSPDENPQLKFYAAGAAFSNPWAISEIELIVVQPRALDADTTGAVKRWAMETTDLLEFMGVLEDAVARAKDAIAGMAVSGSPRFMDEPLDQETKALHTGSHCKFCKAAPVCPAKQAEILEAAQLDVGGLDAITTDMLPDPKDFDVEKLAAMVRGAELLGGWLDQARALIEARLLAGQPVPGWKLVAKIARAKWAAADEEISGYLSLMYGIDEEHLRPRKIVTITETEKLLKAALPASALAAAKEDMRLRFTIKDSAGATMVPASDKREAVNPVASDLASLQPLTAL